MRILVVEDKEMHRASARETLANHDVTIVETFDEAMNLMDLRLDKDDVLIPFPFEVVLTDMMLPMSQRKLAAGVFDPTQQVPYGLIIALRAARVGAKFVAMVTDTNHHHGAISAALDHLGSDYYFDGMRPNFTINGAKVMFVHAPFVEDIVTDNPCQQCKENPGLCKYCAGTGFQKPYSEERPCFTCREGAGKCGYCHGTTKHDWVSLVRKDWGRVLRDLIAE